MRIVNYTLLLFVLMASCQSPKNQEKFKWNAGISSPKHYSAAPFVEYFYEGKSVAGASANVGVGQGWGITMGGFTGGDIFKPVPDSVFVKWSCGIDDILYERGYKLPQKKMIQLFRSGAVNPYGKIDDYTVLVTGTAPGGNVTIWMKAGQVITEIVKFKAQNKGIWMKGNVEYQELMKEVKNSKEYINSETSIYLYLHGVPYSVWESGAKEYDYDIIFCNEADKTNYDRRITGFSKDGSIISHNSDFTDYKTVKWNNRFTIRDKSLKLKNKLPVHIFLQWSTKDNKQWCEAEIVLPNDLEAIFKQQNIDSKTDRKEYYNRIIIGLEKEDKDLPYIFGRIWLSGENKKEEIMRFRAAKSDTEIRKFLVSKYSIPKGFVFPKWEGREPLKTPEIQYWQEK